MTLASIRTKIAAAAGGTLSLDGSDLGVEAIATLFTDYLGGSALTIHNCVVGADGLSISGTMTIGTVTSPAAQVVVLPDAASLNAAGIEVALPLESWKIDLPFTQVDATALGAQGAANPRLRLMATDGSGDPSLAGPGAWIEGDLRLPIAGATTSVVAAPVPPADTEPL
ncbi:MAG: hypothetical protein ABWX67_12015, partial [Allosphingosinicella sp.]